MPALASLPAFYSLDVCRRTPVSRWHAVAAQGDLMIACQGNQTAVSVGCDLPTASAKTRTPDGPVITLSPCRGLSAIRTRRSSSTLPPPRTEIPEDYGLLTEGDWSNEGHGTPSESPQRCRGARLTLLHLRAFGVGDKLLIEDKMYRSAAHAVKFDTARDRAPYPRATQNRCGRRSDRWARCAAKTNDFVFLASWRSLFGPQCSRQHESTSPVLALQECPAAVDPAVRPAASSSSRTGQVPVVLTFSRPQLEVAQGVHRLCEQVIVVIQTRVLAPGSVQRGALIQSTAAFTCWSSCQTGVQETL